jgi:hypothetical protein
MTDVQNMVDRFAEEVVLFQEWALHGTDHGDTAAREALIRITRLYLAALYLPTLHDDDVEDDHVEERVDDGEWKAVYAASARLPFDFYGETFDSQKVPPEDSGVGSLADDIADIYRDVVSGLREHQTNRHARAVWNWTFGFQHHWGRHATGAIRALHGWLASNAPERLTSEEKQQDAIA